MHSRLSVETGTRPAVWSGLAPCQGVMPVSLKTWRLAVAAIYRGKCSVECRWERESHPPAVAVENLSCLRLSEVNSPEQDSLTPS
ncbi:hypothetical protein [Kamptonema formosum]|uniref:hypothetical protein n=1 Tax=Kamptonema formosum TaxID=331992 RepID=UPI0012DDE46D|nr:hypothetical protein [Oscillatoria sp. PCC 10802]